MLLDVYVVVFGNPYMYMKYARFTRTKDQYCVEKDDIPSSLIHTMVSPI